MALKTDYTNDILDTTKNTERKYNIKSASGTILQEGVTFEDVTEYTSEGSRFGANDINATNTLVNTLDTNLTSGTTKFRFGIDGDGNYGYYKADDSFSPFSSKEIIFTILGAVNSTGSEQSVTLENDVDLALGGYTNWGGSPGFFVNNQKQADIVNQGAANGGCIARADNLKSGDVLKTVTSYDSRIRMIGIIIPFSYSSISQKVLFNKLNEKITSPYIFEEDFDFVLYMNRLNKENEYYSNYQYDRYINMNTSVVGYRIFKKVKRGESIVITGNESHGEAIIGFNIVK